MEPRAGARGELENLWKTAPESITSMEPRAGARGEYERLPASRQRYGHFNGASRRSARRGLREILPMSCAGNYFNGASRRSARRADEVLMHKRKMTNFNGASRRSARRVEDLRRFEIQRRIHFNGASRRSARRVMNSETSFCAPDLLQWSLAPEREERPMSDGWSQLTCPLQWSLAPEREESRNNQSVDTEGSAYFNGASRRSARRECWNPPPRRREETSMEPRAGARGEKVLVKKPTTETGITSMEPRAGARGEVN